MIERFFKALLDNLLEAVKDVRRKRKRREGEENALDIRDGDDASERMRRGRDEE